VLRGARLVQVERESIRPTSDFDRFLTAWDVADTETLNAILTRYEPYGRFLECVKTEERIPIPSGNQNSARSELGAWLHDNYDLTFVAFDTFRRWGHILAVIYVAHLDEPAVYWGSESPNLDAFASAVKESWRKFRAMDGFARIGPVAEETCKALRISFKRFEALFQEVLVRHGKETYVSGSALRPIERKWEIQLLLPRQEALTRAALSGEPPQWIQRRFLEDGVLVGSHYVRLLKWGNHP
jgi:hypothetical protein